MHKAVMFLLTAISSLHQLIFCTTSTAADEFDFLLVPRHAEWKYFAGNKSLPDHWPDPSFDDSQWNSGTAGFGYGDSDDRTVLHDMQGRYTSVHIRRTFEIPEVGGIRSVYLYLRFDDGFVAYLNGVRVAHASVTGGRDDRQVALHEAETYEEFEIRDAARWLKPGKNIIAIEGHNAAIDSSDFSLDPVLSLQQIGNVDEMFTHEDYSSDLRELHRRLLDQSSYLNRRDAAFEDRFTQFRKSIGRHTEFSDFVAGLQKLLMLIGDCHAGVTAATWPRSEFYLPLRLADTADGLAALSISGNQLLSSEHPYVESIDGLPVNKWIDTAAAYVPRGSPQLIRREAIGWLGHIELLRRDLGLPAEPIVTVGLTSADGNRRTQKRLRLTRQGFSIAKVPLYESRLLEKRFGYLRIAAMDHRLTKSIVRKLRSFRQTEGLIIDVRDNRGGTYHILTAIYGFFLADSAPPYVANIAAYRLSPQFSKDHIAYRPTYRASWNNWSEQEQAIISLAARDFAPEWQIPSNQFSDWHYMVLSRARSGIPAQSFFHFDKPVIVLCNAGSFSATDVFLSAFADLPQVRLVGQSSGGGSGATRRFHLPNTRIRIAVSSMASFRPNGKLFDGNGVSVDVPVMPLLNDFTFGTDTVLDRALDLLSKAR